MNSKFNFITLIVLFAITFVTGTNYSGDEIERIIGGYPISIKEAPYQVSLQLLKHSGRSTHFCGGSIISDKYVVTASHCVVDEKAEKLIIVAGTANHKKNGIKVKVAKVIMHEQYNDRTVDYDIAVLELENKLNFTKSIRPVKLPDFNETVPDGTMCLVSGWGDTDVNMFLRTKKLRAAKVPIVNQQQCVKTYASKQDLVTPRMLCAGYKKGGRDACQGDSGGPLVCKVKGRKEPKLFGIVSWGFLCAQPIFPGVYGKVSEFRQWVFDKTAV